MPCGDLNALVNHLTENGVLKTPLIIDAFRNIDRAKFTTDEMRCFAYVDEALTIPGGQTISQPYTVAFMLELLEPKSGEKILDIGAGSGWQTALLAHIVSRDEAQGKVFAIEIVPELCKFGKANVAKFNFIEKGIIKWICGDASQKATFDPVRNEVSNGVDKIIAAAALSGEVPQEWKDQLKIGGRLVVPIGNSIWLFIKSRRSDLTSEVGTPTEASGKDVFISKEYPGFVFVPFVENHHGE